MARGRCEECGHDFFVAYSCRCRVVCPSCSTKRSILFGEKVRGIVKPVSHLHITFTIPKMLRAYFRRNRKLLKLLVQSANWTIEEYFTGATEIEGGYTGGIYCIHFSLRSMQALPGFNVHVRGQINGADGDTIEHIARYMSRAAISVDRVEFNPADHTLIISLIEMQLLRIIRDYYPDDSWKLLGLISPKRLNGAEKRFAELRRRNEAIELADCLMFCDKSNIVLKSDELWQWIGFDSKTSGKKILTSLEKDLRNTLVHPQDIITGNWPMIVDLVGQAEDILRKCERVNATR